MLNNAWFTVRTLYSTSYPCPYPCTTFFLDAAYVLSAYHFGVSGPYHLDLNPGLI
jgi:hypothetical protein